MYTDGVFFSLCCKLRIDFVDAFLNESLFLGYSFFVTIIIIIFYILCVEKLYLNNTEKKTKKSLNSILFSIFILRISEACGLSVEYSSFYFCHF